MKSSTRKHAHPALAAFLAISACQGILPAHCFDVKDAEFNVRESEKEANTCPSYYAHCLLILATEYWRIGQANKADRIFRKSIPVAVRSQYVDEGDLKAHLQMWAQLLAEGRDYNGVKKEDFHRLDKATKHVLSETEKHSTLEEKLNAYTFAVQFFDKTGNWKLKNKYKPILLDYCEKVENDSAAIQKDCLKAAAILGGLAEVEFPVGKLNAMPDHAIEIQPDTNTGSKQTRSRFAEADSYKLRELKLIERFPPDQSFLASGHRHLVFWYTLCGAKDRAAEQVEILVRLLGSRDPEVLYPLRQPCPGMCGMG